MSAQYVADAMERVEIVLRRRPDMGLHDDSPATARWRGSTRIVTSHDNGSEFTTDMPGELGGTGDQVTPGWLMRAGLAACTATRIAMGAAAAHALDLAGAGSVHQIDAAVLRERVRDAKPVVLITETISNPLLKVCDIEACAEIAHAAGAKLIVDNTFASPYLCQPLKLGADMVVHSATKYLSGHADATGGVVVSRDEFDSAGDASRWAPVRFRGAASSPPRSRPVSRARCKVRSEK